MKKNEEDLLLAIENIYSEDSVIDQRTLNDEQLPLVGGKSNQEDDGLKSIPSDHLPWHKRPSVSTLPVPRHQC